MMRPGTLHDLPGVYRVCRLTGLAGQDASETYADPDLLGHIWAGPYLVFPDAVALVVQDAHGIAAYCVGVPDTTAYENWLEVHWWPPLRERYPVGSGIGRDSELVQRLHHPPRTDAALTLTHPAHLHIDVLPRLQGRGLGRRLVAELLDRLAVAGAGGVHLGVDEANVGALLFYERVGFTELTRMPGARLYGRVLPAVGGA